MRLERSLQLWLLSMTAVLLMACASAPPGSGERSNHIVIANAGPEILTQVFISGCTDSNWYNDLLEPTEVIHPGGSRRFTQFAPGCWDIKVRFQSGREMETRRARLRAGYDLTWTVR